MKHLFLLLLALGLLLSCEKNAFHESLGAAAFFHLKNNDFKGYSKFLLDSTEAAVTLDALAHSAPFKEYPDAKKDHFKNVRNNLGPPIMQLHKKLEANFYKTFDQGVRKGLTWSGAKFVKVELGQKQAIFDSKQLTQQHIYIIFKHNKIHYRLRLSNNILTKRGWVIVDGFVWEAP